MCGSAKAARGKDALSGKKKGRVPAGEEGPAASAESKDKGRGPAAPVQVGSTGQSPKPASAPAGTAVTSAAGASEATSKPGSASAVTERRLASDAFNKEDLAKLGELIDKDSNAYGGPGRWVYISHGNLVLTKEDVQRVIRALERAGYDGKEPLFMAMCGSGGSVISSTPPAELIRQRFNAVEVVAPRDVVDAFKVSDVAKKYFQTGELPPNFTRFERPKPSRIRQWFSNLF